MNRKTKGIISIFFIIIVVSIVMTGLIGANSLPSDQSRVDNDAQPFTFKYFEYNGKLAPELQSPIERFNKIKEE